MKMQIEVEMTPEELRRFLGLPDVGGMQEEWLRGMADKVSSGEMPSADMATFMRPMMANNTAAMEAFNRAFWQSFAGAANSANATTETDSKD